MDTLTPEISISPPEYMDPMGLSHLDPHIQHASIWADRQFRAFENVKTISTTFGVNFGVQLTVTLTWVRPKELE